MTDLPASVRWQLWIVAFGFFMQSLDTTIVNTALPSMAKSLGESPLHMHMIIVSYVLTVAVMLPASGWLADRVGVRNIFFTAIVLFTAGSLFCAQASTLDQLVMARVLQGVGGAMMVPVGRLTVMKIVPRDQYMAAMTFVTLPGQVGPLLGPALGGVLVEYASWHWIFLINIPVGIVGAIATLCLMPNYTMQTRRFDLSGFLLLAADRYGHGNKTEKAMTLSDALVIGLAQMIAVVPGLSRSGTTISAGMLRGFDRTFAVKFSFFLSIPAVLGANLLSLVKAISAGINWAEIPMYLCGVAAALVSGYLAIFALNRIAQRGKFGGFCYYCWGAGLLTLILSLIS